MLTLRRFYNSATKRPTAVVTPGARTRKSLGGTTNSSSTTNNVSFGARSPSAQQQTRRRRIEKVAVVGILLVAWAWIMVFFGMIFYHGYQYRMGTAGKGAGDRSDADMEQPKQSLSMAVKEQSQPARKEVILEPHASPLVVFTCKRANYLTDTLTDVLQYIPSDCSIGCPVIVSQDGNDEDVSNVIASFQAKLLEEKNVPLVHINHKSALRKGASNSYQALAQHYGWALRSIFDGKAIDSRSMPPDRVIILEEDIHISPDFFAYFAAMTPILERDSTVLAVSAFNDNGLDGKVKDPSRVLRSDFFPGLGWMMSRTLWDSELRSKWPSGYWDDWLREPPQRKDRYTLHPEVSRSFHFGTAAGASHNQFGDKLSKVHLHNDASVDWKLVDTSYLEDDKAFLEYYTQLVKEASLEPSMQSAMEAVKNKNVRVEYRTFHEFQGLARQLGLMDDEKAMIPRTAFHGMVETRPYGEHLLFLVPLDSL